MLKQQWEATKALQRTTGRLIAPVFHRNGRMIKDYRGAWDAACEAAKVPGRIPHDFRRTAVRNLERAGVPRSVAMKLTGHKTESVYRRYAIVSEADLSDGLKRLATLHDRDAKAVEQSRTVTVLAQSRGFSLMYLSQYISCNLLILVPEAGIEPARCFWPRGILSPIALNP